MFKGFIIGVIFTVVVAVATSYFIISNGVIAANADVTPGPIEKWIADTSLTATLRNEAPKQANPVATNDANSWRASNSTELIAQFAMAPPSGKPRHAYRERRKP